MARQGKAKFALINVGGNIDIDAGTVTGLTYPTLSSVMEGIFDMPRASRGGQFALAMTRNHKKAKLNDKYSLFSTFPNAGQRVRRCRVRGLLDLGAPNGRVQDQ